MHQLRSIQMRWVAGVTIGALCALVWGMSAASAEAPALDSVDNIASQLETLEETYLLPAVLESRFRSETRFNEAKVAYMMEDFDRAALLMATLVDTTDPESFPGYTEALYILGDSLYEGRNFRAAREYFRRILEQGHGPFYQPAILRLLETAMHTDDYDDVDELYDRLDDLEDVNAAIHYLRGKTLYQEGRINAARPWFQRAGRDDEFAMRGRYFEGVAAAAEGSLGEADEIFEELTLRSVDSDDDEHVRELAQLARGRIAYEQDEYALAIDHYLRLPRTSPLFTRALYELTWAHVAKGNYQAAIRNLDILLISDPEPQFVPEAKTLMADMAMRLGEYEDARVWFHELIGTFTPVRDELMEFIDGHQDIDEFFVELVRDEMRGLQPDFLPEEVTKWLEDEASMISSRQLMTDGTMTQDDIDSVYEAIEELEAAIDMGSSIEAFPRLAEGWTQGHELHSRLIALQDQLLDWELQRVQPLMSSSEQERLAELEEELERLQAVEERTPGTQEELQERDQAIQDQFRLLNEEIERVAFEIEGLEQTLEGIGQYMRSDSHSLSEQEREEVAQVRQELRDEVRMLEEERRDLSRALSQTRRGFGARDDSLVAHRELRRDIQKLQSQRAELVDASSHHMSTQESAQWQDVAEIRRHLPRIEERLNNYFDEIDRLVDDRIEEIRATLEMERQELATYQAELDDWMHDTEQSVAEVAMYNFIEVHHDFDRLVRRSHLGLVDVDWQHLEDARTERQDLEDDKRQILEMLQEAFPDVN